LDWQVNKCEAIRCNNLEMMILLDITDMEVDLSIIKDKKEFQLKQEA